MKYVFRTLLFVSAISSVFVGTSLEAGFDSTNDSKVGEKKEATRDATSGNLSTEARKAASRTERIFPQTTKALGIIPNLDRFLANLEKTKLGKLATDPKMEPFLVDFKRQLEERLFKNGGSLAISWEDLQAIGGGEVLIGAMHNGTRPASLLTIEISGKEAAAKALLQKIEARQKADGATVTRGTSSGVSYTVLTFPVREGFRQKFAFYGLTDKYLLACDQKTEFTNAIRRLQEEGPQSDALILSPKYDSILKRCSQNPALAPYNHELSWYIDPFGYAQVARDYYEGERQRGKDFLKILKEQGFDAIEGVGGKVYFTADNQVDIYHQTFVSISPEKKLAARMLKFPNSNDLTPPAWVPEDSTTYLALSWDISNAFESFGSLYNAIGGEEDLFEDTIESLKNEESTNIDLRNDIIRHLSNEIFSFTELKKPIVPDSESRVVILTLNDPKAAGESFNRIGSREPNFQRRTYKGYTIWEGIEEEDDDSMPEIPVLSIDGPGFEVYHEEEVDEEVVEMAVISYAVVGKHLVVGTTIDGVKQTIDRIENSEKPLAKRTNYQRLHTVLTNLNTGPKSFYFYLNGKTAYHTTYELFRTGKMPEATNLIGQALNAILTEPLTEAEFESDDFNPTVTREQEFDARKLPPFAEITQYLGTAGFSITSETDGLYISGALLK
ncbi:MAG: DUF3352 domain-containing protein [Pirellulaceae bacterium]|nr:DUF3352 domain-containing protein [Pirellulaceae bacterium]